MLLGSFRRIKLDKVSFTFSIYLPLFCLYAIYADSIGGSLGWKPRGSLDGSFEKTAYELEPSTTASPKYAELKTGFGYHIIMVEGRK